MGLLDPIGSPKPRGVLSTWSRGQAPMGSPEPMAPPDCKAPPTPNGVAQVHASPEPWCRRSLRGRRIQSPGPTRSPEPLPPEPMKPPECMAPRKSWRHRSPLNRRSIRSKKRENEDGARRWSPPRPRSIEPWRRANYSGLDRADVQYSAKEACRHMSAPGVGDWAHLKRLARCTSSKRRSSVEYRFRGTLDGGGIVIFSDSGWGSCRSTRRSAAGVVLMVDGRIVKTSSPCMRRDPWKVAKARANPQSAGEPHRRSVAANGQRQYRLPP